MDKVKILRTPYQGGFRDFQISANANNIDTNDGNNVQTALDNLNDRLNNDINNRFIQNEESIQNLGKDKTAIFDSIDRLEAQIEDIDALFPSEAITAIIENASASQIQAIQYAGNQQLSNITNSGLGQVSNIQNKGASQLSAFETAAADFTDQQIGLIEDARQAQINSFNTDAAAAAQNQIASINSAGTARLTQIEQAIQSKAEQALADIPDDYTELGQQVNDLKDFVDKIQEIGVASAGQLISDNYIEDKIPYLYRPSGGDGADRAIDTIVGGSIVWNQLMTNYNSVDFSGVTITPSENGVILNGVTTSGGDVLRLTNWDTKIVKDHIYLMYVANTSLPSNAYLDIHGNGRYGTLYFPNGSMFKGYETASKATYVQTPTDTSFDNLYIEPLLFDLTQMFGSTIADYVYSLEQATTGAGVAWFRKLFPNSYYPYNAGELMSVSGLQSHDMVGKNFLHYPYHTQSITKAGVNIAVNNDGSIILNGTSIGNVEFYLSSRTYGPLTLQPGTYILSGIPQGYSTYSLRLGYNRGASGATIGLDTGRGVQIVATEETKDMYYGLWLAFSSGATFSNLTIYPMICRVSATDRIYEPYEKRTYALDSSLTLRGIPKLDANNNLYYDGDEYASDGSVKRKYGIVDMGTLTWGLAPDNSYFLGLVPDKAIGNFNIICTKYPTTAALTVSTMSDKQIKGNASNTNLYIKDSSYTDAASFKASLSGSYIVYGLATPTSETADPYANPQIVDPDGAEEYVTTSIVPVGHITKYPENIRAKIDGLPWNLSMIAPVDNGTTATRAYSTGQYFMHNNQFCKAKTSIARGATFTLNTNYEVTTVAAELYAALH